ncbi:MAG: hypothetical protein IT316_11340 [Anaerolineales bacterium]|nr:hypothetical protein [Anaerolineales bacterium]
MKQQEAIDFIQAELAKARTIKQISADLSSRLNAPKEVVEEFVKKVANEAVAVDFLTDGVIRTPSTPPVIDQETFNSAIAISENPPSVDLPSPKKPAAQPEPKPSTAVQSPAEEGVSSSPPPDFIKPLKYDKAAVETFVRQELGRQHEDDVIMRLCEATGMSWPEAHKIVTQIAARKRKVTARNQNLISIALSLIALLAGTALVITAVSQQPLILDPASLGPEEIKNLYSDSRQLLWAFLLGSALGIGGLVGLALSARKPSG